MRLAALLVLVLPTLAHADQRDLYRQRIDELDRRLTKLRSEVLEEKARLLNLQARYVPGHAVGTRARIVHRNDMSPIYTPVQMVYALDGAQVFARSNDDGVLGGRREIEVFAGPLAPENHTLSVKLVYRGNGYMFHYVQGYRFTVQSSYTFSPADGRETVVKVVGKENGNPMTTDMADRPAIDFRTAIGGAAERR